MIAKYLHLISVLFSVFHLNSTLGLKVTFRICGIRSIMEKQRNEETIMLLKRVEDIGSFIRDTTEVCEMRLSLGNLTLFPNGIFQNFTSLLELSLAGNNIQTIPDKAFVGLSSLQTLDLRNNPLQEWNTSGISCHIPRLTSLDMTSSMSPWHRSLRESTTSLFKLPYLNIITGVSWSQSCSNCTFLRTSNATQLSFYGNSASMFIKNYACRYKTTSPSNFIRGLASNGFLATCVLTNHECFESEVKTEIKAPCRETTLGVMSLEYVFGSVAMILNMIVIVTFTRSKCLHRNHDMLLVTNIAIGDFCTGLYSLVIISVHQTKTFNQMETFAPKYCIYIGFFWILGQSLAVSFALVLTIERFKCVVRRRNRQSRMSAMELLIASSVCWVYALSTAILPATGIGNYHLNTFCIPIFPTSNPVQFYYSIIVSGTSAIMYIASIPLYAKMYFFVRKSSKNMRVRADIELAKRVFSLVLTNMVFFLLPIIISLVFARVERSTSQLSREVSEVLNAALPLACLTINSALNPILYSFRSRLFRKELSSWTCKIYPTTDNSMFNIGNTRSIYVVQRATQQGSSLSTL